MSFGLKALNVKSDQTRWYDFPSILTLDTVTQRPVGLQVVPAVADINKALQAARAALPRVYFPSNKDGQVRAFRELLKQDIELYPVHVIKDWRHVVKDGQPVPYSPEACQTFLRELHDEAIDLFLEFRMYCLEPSNWRPHLLDVEGIAKN